MLDAVLFDWDGSLADTREVILLSFKGALKKIGVVVPDAFIERRIGIGAEETFVEIIRAQNKRYAKNLVRCLVHEKIQSEIKFSGRVKLLPGAVELLKSLNGKLKLALTSMNNKPVIDHLLEELNIREFFDVILTVEDVTNFKPNPEIFLKCSSLLGVSPGKCLVVEDSLFGVQAGKAAGMKCLAVLTGVYGEAELAKANPDMILESLSDTTRVLNFILE